MRGQDKNHSSKCVRISNLSSILISRVVAIVDIDGDSLPLRRYREQLDKEGKLVDVTAGKLMKSLVLTDSGQVFISHISAETLHQRIDGANEVPHEGSKK